MSNNIFEQRTNYQPKVQRNTFNLSFQNNLSMRFGRLTPVLCKEVLPGDTFNIKSSAVMFALPTKFPVQTPMRMNVHFFYCRNRNAVKGWEGFIKGTTPSNEFDMPWLKLNEERARKMISTGSLGDYLGVPTTLVGQRVPTSIIEFPTKTIGYRNIPTMPLIMTCGSVDPITNDTILYSYIRDNFIGRPFIHKCLSDNYKLGTTYKDAIEGSYALRYPNSKTILRCKISGYLTSHVTSTFHFTGTVLPYGTIPEAGFVNLGIIEDGILTYIADQDACTTSLQQPFEFYASDEFVNNVNTAVDAGKQVQIVCFSCLSQANREFSTATALNVFRNNLLTDPSNTIPLQQWALQTNIRNFTSCYTQSGSTDSVSDATDPLLINSNPFVGDNPKIRLNALPFRHYEMIYNSFYREQNQPYVLNDKVEYDEFCPTKEQGSDTNVYDFYKRNWERDYFTSCVGSPQFGVAPLVGVTINTDNTATMTFQNDPSIENPNYIELDGSMKEFKTFAANLQLSKDGKTLVGINTHSHDLPSGNLNMLMDAITIGMSINDFRNVNAFQRFKETMMRAKSFRYKDQMAAQYGVDVDGVAIDTPTFEGGFSFDIDSSEIYNATESNNYALGDLGGRITLKDVSKHSVNIYCREHGYIMAIASITPLPIYPQLLPKHFCKRYMLDYGGKKEFNPIGYVPVTVKELTPIQASYENRDLNETFGYQQAWSEYVSSQDEAHGEMRTSMRDFILHRVFANTPSLNDDFLTVDSASLNDIFAYQGDDDKFKGSIYFNIIAHRQVPKFSIPSIA